MRLSLKLIIVSMTFSACADSSQKDTSHSISQFDTVPKIDTVHKTTTASQIPISYDTLIVDRQSAVFVEPDSLTIEKRKKQIGEEAFYAGADDYLFYMNTAHEFLDSVKLTKLNTKDNKFIKFVYTDKTQEVVRLDKLPELWNVYFFDPAKKARQVDMTIIDEEYKNYFK